MNLWQRKLLAYLHDPPGKPFNIAEHREMAETLIRSAGFDPADVWWFFDKVCDHTAAAADRVVCPRSSVLHADFKGDAGSPFHHPLGGGKLIFENPVPSAEFAETIVQQAQEGLTNVNAMPPEKRDWAKFFLHWRLWPQRTAQIDGRALHVPADTRIPDHTIWTHCSIVSALQACVEISKEGPHAEVRNFRPAFLLVQIGPVQEFIAQARTTRDLWSGSYLLSWLIAHGIKAVTDAVGPDCVLFPALRGQPLFDFLHRTELYEPLDLWEWTDSDDTHILTPNLPNRFLAVVPADGYEIDGKYVRSAQELAGMAERAMQNELTNNIYCACLQWFADKGHAIEPDAFPRWQQQLGQFLTVYWQVWPWAGDVKTAISNFKSLPLGLAVAEGQTMSPEEALDLAHQAAIQGIPQEHLDPRNYGHRSWKEGDVWKSEVIVDRKGNPLIENAGFAWAAHYGEAEFLLAARRNARDFEPWAADDDKREGAVKDMLSGKEEVVGSEEWQHGLSNINGHFFREGEQLGAMNLIKRVWHAAYLQPRGLKRTPRFDSLPAVAASSFDLHVTEAAREREGAWRLLLDFQRAASETRGSFGAPISGASNEAEWVEDTDASVFHLAEWDGAIRDAATDDARRKLRAAREALARLLGKDGLDRAPRGYVAVLAMDGDSMGEWVSGAKSPAWRMQLANEAVEYFNRTHAGAHSPGALQRLLDAPRHVSPSYHLQLSEALANFALYLAGPIVEHFDGQLIYAGGDDLLAMLPAEKALDCAQTLRMAFRGDPKLDEKFPGVLRAADEQWGFVAINGEWNGWERWQRRFLKRGYHLLVPGRRADISAGIAIGHMRSPLQNLVEAARRAESRAKKEYGKSSFVISLFKRSGETIQWGAKWDSHAIELTAEFTRHSSGEKPALSGRFPYALAELLRGYAVGPEFGIVRNNSFDPFKVFAADFGYVVRQQGGDVAPQFTELANIYLLRCENRRLDDFLGPFLTTTFIERGGE